MTGRKGRMKDKGLRKSLEIAGLGFALALDLIAGPLFGLLVGTWLEDQHILPPPVRLIAIIAGFAASVLNAVILLKRMYRLSRDS